MVKIRRISSTSSGSSSEDDDNDDSDDSIKEKGSTGSGTDRGHREGGHGPPEQGLGDEDEVDDDDEADEGKASCAHCTYAVTGNTPTFQAIFVCHACCKDNDDDDAKKEPLCICQACAEACHADHEDQVEYIGMGPCYCDCNQLGDCCILAKSNLEAERLGMYPKSLKEQEEMIHNNTILTSINSERDDTCHEQKQDPPQQDCEKFVQDVYRIPLLLEQLAVSVRGEQETPETEDITSTTSRTVTDLLIEQAHELIQHSKETHWVDQSMFHEKDKNVMTLSPLERLAWSIFQRHAQHYKLTPSSGGGAEWWVQVKPANSSRTITTSAKGHTRSGASGMDKTINNNHNPQQGDQAIDLHYDKDEALAESFGLGLFPTLSTVTYLTTGAAAATTTTTVKDPQNSDGNQSHHNPTLVFPHMYHQEEDEMISSMLLSRPMPGKHLVFDGRLLHGAPSHDALVGSPSASTTIVTTHGSSISKKKEKKRQKQPKTDLVASNENAHEEKGPLSPSDDESTTFRVTFLVNLWIHRQPSNVQPLDAAVRQALQHKLKEENGDVALTNWLVCTSSDKPNDQTLYQPQQLTMTPSPITEVTLDKEDDLPVVFQNRIELPFVTKGITWDEDDYDDSSGLVLTTFPPPARAEDTLMVQFGPGMQAYLEYLHSDEDEDHPEEHKPTMSRHTSNTDTKGSSIPVDYRTTIQDCYV
jgi:hypothetical protein